MKTSTKLKLIAIILTIILISLISFFGLYVRDNWKMKNLLPDYSFGMSLKGYKTATFKVDDSETEVPVDDETQTDNEEIDTEQQTEEDIASNEDEEQETKTVPVNPTEILTLNNFKKCKEIINTRLKLQKAGEYAIRQNTEDGTIVIDIINEDKSDPIIQNVYERGAFEGRNQETGEVLLTNSDVKNARIGYTQVESGETYLVISITFNKEGAKKLEKITEEFTEESEKILELYVDTLKFGERYFNGKISNGELNVPIATNAKVDLSLLEPEAKYMAHLIKSEPMPISYVMDTYGYTEPVLDKAMALPIAIIAIILFGIFKIYFIYKYKNIGFFSMLNTIGFVAALLIVLRLTHATITESGLFGIVLATALQILLSIQILEAIKDKLDTKVIINTKIMEFVKIMLPLMIVSIIFAFITWLPINSFGIIIFWGFVVNILFALTLQKLLFIELNKSSKGGSK